MCGIAGFTFKSEIDPGAALAALSRQLAPIASRGPDQHGNHVGQGIALGHVRLSVIDLQGGRQPRVDPETGDALIFNGEIYGHDRLRSELRRRGVELRDRSDTEVLFQFLRHHGVAETLNRIDGMFAFAYFDAQRRRLHLARDRFGEKPLYWGEAAGQIVFGSEPRAVLAHPSFTGTPVDLGAVGLHIHFEYIPGDRSLRAGLRKLRPGHRLEFSCGSRPLVIPYWNPDPSEQGVDVQDDERDRIARLDSLLDASIRERIIADVPVGVFLSGGIDSSLVAAIAAKYAPGIRAFTIRMPEASYDETHAATQLAASLGMKHEVADLDDGALIDSFEAVTARMDEPLADASLLPTYTLCHVARRHATVALSGDGADELFAGYVSFKANRAALPLNFMPPGLGRVIRSVLTCLPRTERYMSPEFMLQQLSYAFGLRPERQWSACMAPFAPSDTDRLWRGDARNAVSAAMPDPIAEMLDTRRRRAWSTAELLYLFTCTYLPEDILHKVDRASMMVSLEVRAPFLARAFAEYAMSLPSSDKIRGFSTKYLLRKLALRYLPHEIVHMPKHGFAVPLGRLLRHVLAGPVGDALLDRASPLAEWFERTEIERLWSEHRSGARDHRKKIWTLFTLATAVRNTQSR